MPVTPTYPGVYIEEIPSGVRTITGVATSITAFLGFAPQGPTNDPIRIQSFADYTRLFGGLALDSTMSYAVQHFFRHGGTDAVIIRLANSGKRASVKLAEGLILEAIAPGDDGNQLSITVNYDSVPDAQSFNLVLKKKDSSGTETEVGKMSSVKFGDFETRFNASDADEDLKKLRALVRMKGSSQLTDRPPAGSVSFGGGKQPGTSAKILLPIYQKNTSGEVIFENGKPKPDTNETPLVLEALSEGAWGNQLQAFVDYDVANPDDRKTFNLTVQRVEGDEVRQSELLRNLSLEASSNRYFVEVIRAESNFVRVDGELPTNRPDVPPVDKANNNQLVLSKADNNGGNGDPPTDDSFYVGDESAKTGLYALEKTDLFNLLCVTPPNRKMDVGVDGTLAAALEYCVKRRAVLLVDPPSDWTDARKAEAGIDQLRSNLGAKFATNAAVYFPRLKMGDPLKENRTEEFVPCGAIAGILSRTDAQRGVWKAPAGIEATFSGVRELTYKLTDGENGLLNPKGVNCLRFFPDYGNVVWGARTVAGSDRLASEWKYLPVRRIALFLQESLYRGTQWVVFEPNDEPLWAQIRLNIGAFMNTLFRQGAFQGKTPSEAYFVKCDKETTTQNDIDRGIVNIIVGFAPLKPAEFVILKFQQIAGQIQT